MTNEFPVIADRVVEPLAESAPIQWKFAQEFCGESCRWYHGPRLYLRALGIVRGLQLDTAFMLDAIGRVARTTEHARVLVSGSADYGTLAHVLAAFRAANRSLTVTVVDTCLTPLRINAWYGERSGVPVDIVHGDIFHVPEGEPFDLICTHAFFGRFDARGRQRLGEKWRTLLKPGGVAVTAHGMRHGGSDDVAPFSARQKQGLRERARRALSDTRLVDVPAETIAAWTADYIRRKTTHPVHTVEEIERPLTAAGFDVAISRAPSDDGPWRMGVVATRRS